MSSTASCADPVSAVLETMTCIDGGDASCANSGYSRRGYDKFHNTIKVPPSPFPAETYWTSALKFSSFTTKVKYTQNIGKNKAEIRYIESIKMNDGSNFGLAPSSTYPFGASFKQHEHALVTVDDDCKIIHWDQYGDNKEQSDVEEAINAMKSQTGFEETSPDPLIRTCEDPLAAIIKVMDCIEQKNSSCANDGYNWMHFRKYHNGIDDKTRLWPLDVYWSMALKFSTFILDYDHTQNIPDMNMASVRYVETIKFSDGTEFDIEPSQVYPFSHEVIQYEHAIVSVDYQCKITRWDQYGDNAEQVDVFDTLDAMMSDNCVKQALNIPFAGECKK